HGKRRLAGQAVEEHAGEAVDVAAAVDAGVPHALFRGGEQGRHAKTLGGVGVAHHVHDAEVEHAGGAAAGGEPHDRDVVGLQIAVDDARAMCLVEAVGDLPDQIETAV